MRLGYLEQDLAGCQSQEKEQGQAAEVPVPHCSLCSCSSSSSPLNTQTAALLRMECGEVAAGTCQIFIGTRKGRRLSVYLFLRKLEGPRPLQTFIKTKKGLSVYLLCAKYLQGVAWRQWMGNEIRYELSQPKED